MDQAISNSTSLPLLMQPMYTSAGSEHIIHGVSSSESMTALSSEAAPYSAALLTSEPMMDYDHSTVNPIVIHNTTMMEATSAATITAPVVPSMNSISQPPTTTGYESMYNPLPQSNVMAAVTQPMYTPVIASDNHAPFSSHLQVAGQQHQQAEAVLATSSQILMDPMTSIPEPDMVQAHATVTEAANVLQHRQQVLQDCVQAAVNNAVPDQYVSSCIAEHQQRMNHAMAANNTLMTVLERKQRKEEKLASTKPSMPRRHTVSTPYHQRVANGGALPNRVIPPQRPSKHGRRQSLSDLAQLILPSDSELKAIAPEAASSGNFDQMTREELIARLVQLEKQKRSRSDSTATEELNGRPSGDNLLHMESTSPSMSSPLSSTEQSPQLSDREDVDDNEDATRQRCGWINCGQEFDIMDDLIVHVRDIHIGSGKPMYSCEWEGCPRNQKPFTKRHKMHNHVRTHTGERPYVCTVEGCGKRFSRPDSLNTHIKTHSNERPYVCPQPGCKKAYFHSRSLKKHERAHEQQTAVSALPTRSHPYFGAYRGNKAAHDMLPASCSIEALPNWVAGPGAWVPNAAAAVPNPAYSQQALAVLPSQVGYPSTSAIQHASLMTPTEEVPIKHNG
ncbi:hypothetical protein VKS41_005954 [Umbelopsis sp. WA50703]